MVGEVDRYCFELVFSLWAFFDIRGIGLADVDALLEILLFLAMGELYLVEFLVYGVGRFSCDVVICVPDKLILFLHLYYFFSLLFGTFFISLYLQIFSWIKILLKLNIKLQMS